MRVKHTIQMLEQELASCKTDEDYSVLIFKIDNILRSSRGVIQRKHPQDLERLLAIVNECNTRLKKLHQSTDHQTMGTTWVI